MKLTLTPSLLALLCSAGLFAASGTLYVRSRAPETPPAVQPAPAATAAPAAVAQPAYSAAQID